MEETVDQVADTAVAEVFLVAEAVVVLEAEEEVSAVIGVIDKCLTRFVIIAEKIARFLLDQLKVNRFTVQIVLKKWVEEKKDNPQVAIGRHPMIDQDLRTEFPVLLKPRVEPIWVQ